MDIGVHTMAMAMGSAWLSGINVYATVATLGLLGRYAYVQLPGTLDALTNWWVIGIAGVMYCIECVADKIPAVDTAWDAVHTFIRVPAGAVLAASSVASIDPTLQLIAFVLGGGLALTSHSTKATARAAMNTSPEPITNIAASTAEDILAVGGTVLAVLYPVAILVLVIAGVIASCVIIPKMVSHLRRVIGFVSHWREKLRHWRHME
ncbi:MAG: DUF4126 domain-containing protein [Bacteroidota bacterium]|nr:DUF4126 domain-containing protein [Candidatus Kapabacteria bacterium]MDW8219174.1 DUF4126 domain-containing protein [Bacteroidota bacterium]